MNSKRLFTVLALLSVPFSSVGYAAPAMAQSENSSEPAVELCLGFRESGVLDRLGYTFGDCVNVFASRDTDNINRLIAGACVTEANQERVGATNRGECVSAWHERLRETIGEQP